MKKIGIAVLSCFALLLVLLPMNTEKAYAQDYDRIISYEVDVYPNAEDGTLEITVTMDWMALETLEYGTELKIGIPNGSIRNVQALTDNIESLDNDNSYMFVYLDHELAAGETEHFAYSWVQEYMYTIDEENGTVCYDYTPGWFDEILVDQMIVRWYKLSDNDYGNVTYSVSNSEAWEVVDGVDLVGTNLDYGDSVTIYAEYTNWPGVLDSAYSANNLPDEYGGYSGSYEEDDSFEAILGFIVFLLIVYIIVYLIIRAISRSCYAGGFGTANVHPVYVFHDGLWFPSGPDHKPLPGSVGLKTKPSPPKSSSSGFGGSSRGGGFGGGGFGGSSRGGGGHSCACASSCACACACACAGGGRAGCSAKNLYGAVRLKRKIQ